MWQRASSGSGGGSGVKAEVGSQAYSGSQVITVHSGLTDIKRITVTCVTNASNDYISSFVYVKHGSTICTQAYYTLANGGGVNNTGTKHALTSGALAQCPNVNEVQANGDVKIYTPNGQTWNTGTVYWVITEE